MYAGASTTSASSVIIVRYQPIYDTTSVAGPTMWRATASNSVESSPTAAPTPMTCEETEMKPVRKSEISKREQQERRGRGPLRSLRDTGVRWRPEPHARSNPGQY